MEVKEFYSVLYKRYRIMPPDKFDQDWCFTVGDSKDIEDYIDFYNENSLSTHQKSEIINMIIQGFDDLIGEETDSDSINRIWDRIKKILTDEKWLHNQTILYWSCIDTELEEDRFYVSRYIRELL